MRLKSSRRDAGGGGGGCSLWEGGVGEARGAGGAPIGSAEISALAGAGPEWSSRAAGGGGGRISVPPSRMCWRFAHCSPPVSQEVRPWVFRGSGIVGAPGQGGACAQRPGGGGGCAGGTPGGAEAVRASEAGWAWPSQEDGAGAPVRRSSGTSTCRRGATRGGTLGHRGPAEGSVCPSCRARQQRLMPQARLLHVGNDSAPCSKHSVP